MPTGMMTAIAPSTLTAVEVLLRAASTSVQTGVHRLLELRDQAHDRLLVLLVLSVEKEGAGAVHLLVWIEGGLHRAELVRSEGWRHGAGGGEGALGLQRQPHRVQLSINQRLRLLDRLFDQVQFFLGCPSGLAAR